MAYTKYSLTPSSNTAAPPDGAPEGMLPSAVNDTMRDMMAQIRDCGDGIRDGTYTMTAPKITGGTITGSTINNSAIGGTTATTGKFTTLEATGVATFSAGAVGTPAITTTGDTNTGIFFPAADTIAFTEGGAESMRIDSGGRLIVGGTSAVQGARIESVGNTSGDALALRGRSADDLSNLVFIANAAITEYARISGINTSSLTFGTGSGGVERMRITSTGTVAIGTTTTPTAKLWVESGRVGLSNTYKLGWHSNPAHGDLNNYITGDDSTNYVAIGTGASERMRIDSSGNLLVGTTSADGKFAVHSASTTAIVGYFSSNTASYTGSHIQTITQTASGTGFNHLICYSNTGGTTNLKIIGNGNVQNANNSYGAISDVKLKENIVDASPKLANLMQVKVRNYNLKTDQTHKQIGVIAQELEQIFPSMVEETPDRDIDGNDLGTTTKAVKYSVFVPMLIKSMQEQQALIENLTTRLNALEGN